MDRSKEFNEEIARVAYLTLRKERYSWLRIERLV